MRRTLTVAQFIEYLIEFRADGDAPPSALLSGVAAPPLAQALLTATSTVGEYALVKGVCAGVIALTGSLRRRTRQRDARVCGCGTAGCS